MPRDEREMIFLCRSYSWKYDVGVLVCYFWCKDGKASLTTGDLTQFLTASLSYTQWPCTYTLQINTHSITNSNHTDKLGHILRNKKCMNSTEQEYATLEKVIATSLYNGLHWYAWHPRSLEIQTRNVPENNRVHEIRTDRYAVLVA